MNLNTEHYDRRTKRGPGCPPKNTCAPARVRDGKPFGGGRTLRRRMARLVARQNAYDADNKTQSRTKPGSMTK